MSTPSTTPCPGGGDYCPIHPSLNASDLFTTCFVLFLLIFTTIFYYWVTISSPKDDRSNNSNSSQRRINKSLWWLAYCACTFIYLRELTYAIAWVFWIVTFDYAPTSGCFILHYTSHGLWIFSGTFLYFFYMYRLWLVYNSPTNSMFGIKMYNYVILITLNILYFASLTMIFINWKWFNASQYAIFQGTCLFLEIVMAVYISTLLVTPLLRTNNESIQNSEPILNILAKLSILSSISLGMTAVLRILLVITFAVCGEEECWLTFLMYNTWSMDSAINIFCILCSFHSGNKYYKKYCNLLHKYTMSKIIANGLTPSITSIPNYSSEQIPTKSTPQASAERAETVELN